MSVKMKIIHNDDIQVWFCRTNRFVRFFFTVFFNDWGYRSIRLSMGSRVWIPILEIISCKDLRLVETLVEDTLKWVVGTWVIASNVFHGMLEHFILATSS